MNVLDNSYDCTGCGVCSLKCPQNAIEMKEDNEGFLYPNINELICVNCNICRSQCPQNEPINELTNSSLSFWGGVIDSEDDLLSSSSGGAFTAIVNALGDDLIVCGAVYDENLKVKHIVDDRHDVFRKSKYVQSYVTDSYQVVKGLLNSGKKVLFTGTACQVAGLRSFLGKEYENLFTIDLICHGVPSQKVFDSYISSLQKRNNKLGINCYSFREKRHFWGDWEVGISYGNGEKMKYHAWGQDPYMFGFLRALYYRPSCYKCRYANAEFMRPGDFTIGDFWGARNVDPRFDEKHGSSVIIINTIKANSIVEDIKKYMFLIPVEREVVVAQNHNLIEPTKENSKRSEFFLRLSEGDDFFDIMKKYMKKKSHSQRVRVILSKLFPSLIEKRRQIVRKERNQ